MSRHAAALLAVSLLAATPLAAEPRIDVAITGETVEIAATDAPPAAVLQRLAEVAQFSVAGSEGLPSAPLTLHLRGSLERVLGVLLDPASRIATYAADGKHLSRLVLLPTGTGQPRLVATLPPPPRDLAPDDPAVGASRLGADKLRAGIQGTLGIELP